PRSAESRSSCSALWKNTMPSSFSTPTSFEQTAGGIRVPVSIPCRRSRALVARMVRWRMRKILWTQGVLRHSDEEIMESAVRDWRPVLTVMGDGPFFFGNEPTGVDAIVFAALATTVLTPIESPIGDFLRSQPACIAYAERMRARFFPELTGKPPREV